jgi:hypothetical protein
LLHVVPHKTEDFRSGLVNVVKDEIGDTCNSGREGEKRNACKMLAVNLKERDNLDDLAVDDMKRLHCI